jgi:hypothetical protein
MSDQPPISSDPANRARMFNAACAVIEGTNSGEIDVATAHVQVRAVSQGIKALAVDLAARIFDHKVTLSAPRRIVHVPKA